MATGVKVHFYQSLDHGHGGIVATEVWSNDISNGQQRVDESSMSPRY
ncbi:hypothetical protein [Trinickia mobilis]|nr:hypothetical protein [Trinickia mobilis]